MCGLQIVYSESLGVACWSLEDFDDNKVGGANSIIFWGVVFRKAMSTVGMAALALNMISSLFAYHPFLVYSERISSCIGLD